LTVDLFLDATDKRGTVEEDLEKLRRFVRIDGSLHAPPVCAFVWGDVNFEGVVTGLRETFNLFNEDGRVSRAKASLTMKSYRAAEVRRHAAGDRRAGLRRPEAVAPDRAGERHRAAALPRGRPGAPHPVGDGLGRRRPGARGLIRRWLSASNASRCAWTSH